jgi:hypothetical protein
LTSSGIKLFKPFDILHSNHAGVNAARLHGKVTLYIDSPWGTHLSLPKRLNELSVFLICGVAPQNSLHGLHEKATGRGGVRQSDRSTTATVTTTTA